MPIGQPRRPSFGAQFPGVDVAPGDAGANSNVSAANEHCNTATNGDLHTSGAANLNAAAADKYAGTHGDGHGHTRSDCYARCRYAHSRADGDS